MGVIITLCDNGNEFAYRYLYNRLDIIHQASCIKISQQNSIVEKKDQHILNITRSLLFQSNIL